MLVGYDLSNHNSETTIAKAMTGDFIICKATEGVAFNDAAHRALIERTRDTGLLPGHYHYPHPGHNSVIDEVDHFLSFANPQVGDVLALDFEPYADRKDGTLSKVHLPTWILDFRYRVEDTLDCSCWLYLNGDWGDTVMAQASAAEVTQLHKMCLWKATQGTSTAGRTWSWPVLTCWQWDASDGLDKDKFYGDADTWRTLGVQGGSMAHDPLDTADIKKIFTTDVVPAPKDAPDIATNPTWQAVSYLREILAAAKKADNQAQLADLEARLTASVAKAATDAVTAALADIEVSGSYTLTPKPPA